MAGNPLLEGGFGSGKSNPLLSPGGAGTRSKANPLFGPSSGSTSEDLPVLEQTAQDVGAPTVAQDSPGVVRRALDLISRPNYAVAGAAEEAFAPQGGGLSAVPGRVVNELFSGVGSLKGQKEGFGQVMEQAGVPQLGQLSDILGPLYAEHGTGGKFVPEKGGALDITGRGALGFVGDVALDPLTYVSPVSKIAEGRYATKFAGAVVPGTEKAATVIRDATKATIKSVPAFDKALDAVGGIFNRDWKIRNLPGAIQLKQAHLNRQNHETALLYDALGNSKVASIPKSERAAFVDAMDQGTWETKYANDPKMLEAATQFKQFNTGFAINDVEHGLLEPKDIRENYAAHFYDNSPEELNKVMSIWPGGKKYAKATLGRHAEVRAFDTLEQAEKWSKAQHALDPSIPVLKPVRDPLEILRRRGEASINGAEFKTYYQEIVDKFGRQDIPFEPNKFHELTQAVPIAEHEANHIDVLLAAGKTPIEEFQKLSSAGKQEFMRQRLLASKEAGETLGVLRKYGLENAPKQTSVIGTLAEDGTPYKSVTLGTLKAEIPQSMAQDLADMSERVLKSRELDYMLRNYDRANNVFKSFVTVGFAAFHFRNAYSNIAQGFADVGISMLNPARHFDAIAAMRGAEGDLITKAGERIPYTQIKEEMARNGVTTTGRRLAEYTGQTGIDRLSTTAGKLKAAPRAIGGTIENEARATLYTVYRRRGMDVAEASARVNQFLFDYTNLSRVEQDVFRRMVPFYTWQRKNLVQQFKNLATKPGLTAAELKPLRGREDENGSLASWDAEALKFRLNRDGRTLRVLSGVDLPFKNLDLLWNGTARNTLRQGVGMLSPAIKAPMELAFGVNAFTGQQMGRQQSNTVGRMVEHSPEPIQKWLGYSKEIDAAGRPKYTFDGERFYALFQSWALSRIVSTSDRQFKTFSQDQDWSKIMLNTLTGMQDKTFNLDEEQARRLNERKRQLEESLIRWGQRKEFKRVYQPKGPPK